MRIIYIQVIRGSSQLLLLYYLLPNPQGMIQIQTSFCSWQFVWASAIFFAYCSISLATNETGVAEPVGGAGFSSVNGYRNALFIHA